MEAGAVLAKDGTVVHWHLPADRSSGALPDSRPLWDVLWESRDRLAGFAHSHPGKGLPGPSETDLSTFEAVEAGLGIRLSWWITSETDLILVRWSAIAGRYDATRVRRDEEPGWVPELRRHSY